MIKSNNKVCVVVLAGGDIQHKAIWPSYNECRPGVKHDLIVVHRDKLNLPNEIKNSSGGSVIYLNKIINGVDVPHRAFGGYRFAFNTHKDKYDTFIFISDDVVIRRNDWISDIVERLYSNDKIGFGATQIFNGHKSYPHKSHLRAPIWFAKKEVLEKAKWEFNSDHDGEMSIGEQLAETGYVGVQVGNKIDLAYDSYEKDHITQLLERKYFNEKNLSDKFFKKEYDFFKNNINKVEVDTEFIISPFKHIAKQNVYIDIEPFDGLIFYPTLDNAKKDLKVKEILKNTWILDDE